MRPYYVDKSREQMAAEYFRGVGAEIGTERGFFAHAIFQAAPAVTKLYCIDAWRVYRGYIDHTRQAKLERWYNQTRELLSPFNCEIIRKFSMEAVEDFPDESLDFVYIDANHSYRFVFDDVTEWTKKVKPGGVVAGHDYVDRPERGETYEVIKAVNNYLRMHPSQWQDSLTVYTNNKTPSWMFRKL